MRTPSSWHSRPARDADAVRRPLRCIAFALAASLLLWAGGVAAATGSLEDLTPQVTASLTDARTSLDRRTREYVVTANLRVTNTGQRPVVSPVHAVFTTAPEGVKVMGASGGPGTEPYGRYYLDLSGSLTGGILAAGQTLKVPVRIASRVRFQYSINVYGVLAEVSQNQPPELTSIAPQTVAEGSSLTFTVSAADPDSDDRVTLQALAIPGGATFDPLSGSFSWTPGYDQAGDYNARFRATDAQALSADLDVSIRVTDVDRPPSLSYGGPIEVAEGESLLGQITAVDPDGAGAVTVDVGGLPDTAELNPSTGAFTWAPGYSEAGDYLARFTAIDAGGVSSELSVEFRVLDTNRDPAIESTPPTGATAGAQYVYQVAASDPDGDAPAFRLVEGPAGAALDPQSGRLTWTPLSGPGLADFSIEVSDGRTGRDTQSFQVMVEEPPDETPPVIESVDLPSQAVVGTSVPVSAVVTDDRGVAQVRFLVGGVLAGTDTEAPYEAGIAVPAAAGGTTLTVTVEAEDAAGNQAQTQRDLPVVEPPDTASPVVRLTAPASVLAGGVLTLTAEVGDNRGVASVAFEVDGLVVRELNAGPYRLDYNVPEVPGTVLAVRVVGRDAAGNAGEAVAEVAVTDAPDTEPPVIATLILPPSAAAGSSVQARAEVTDDRGVALVRFLVGGVPVATDDQAPFEAALNVPIGSAGQTLLVRVEAEDAEGNQGSAEAELPVVEAADTGPPTQVTLTAPAEALPGTLVRLDATAVDDVGVLKLVFLVNGVEAAEDVQAPYMTDYRLPADAQPRDLLRLQAVAYDFSGNHASSAIVDLLVLAPGEGLALGMVFDDETGLPLEGVRVVLGSVDGDAPDPAVETQSGPDGAYRLDAPAGALRLNLSLDGYTSALRDLALAQGTAVRVADVRLTPELQAAGESGGVLSVLAFEPQWRLVTPADASPSSADVTLVPFGAQALPAPLPLGWTPVAGVVVQGPGAAFSPALELTYDDPSQDLVPAQWRGATGAWVRVESAVDDVGVKLPLTGAGWFVLLRPDTRPAAPPVPAVGGAVNGVDPVPIPDGATARVLPSPDVIFMHPSARSDVRVVLGTTDPLPSGTPIQVQVTERYDRTDGSRLLPAPFVETLRLYQRPGGLGAAVAVSPSRTFDPALLQEGQIRLSASAAASAGVALAGPTGGSVSGPGGEHLQIPPGALSDEAPITLELLDISGRDDGTVAALKIGLAGAALAQAAELRVPRPAALADDAQVLLVKTWETALGTHELLVDLATVEAGRLVFAGGALGLPLPGVREGGLYRLAIASEPLGFVTGNVTAPGGATPVALVEADVLAFVSRTGPSRPAYVLAAPLGEVAVSAFGLADGASAEGGSLLATRDAVAVLDLALAAAGLEVTMVDPADGAEGVPDTASVRVLFSRSLDSASLEAGSVRLLLGGTDVAAAAAVLPDGRTLLLTPADPLRSETTYRLRLAPGLRDRFGNGLAGNQSDGSYVSAFTTADTTPPPRPEPGQITVGTPVNGSARVSATQGSVEPGALVTVLNRATGIIVSVLAGADGSFELSIAADIVDDLELRLQDQAGNETWLDVGKPEPPPGTGVLGADGGFVAGPEEGTGVTIPPGVLGEDAVVSIEPLDISGLAPPFNEDIPGRFGGAMTLRMQGVELTDLSETRFEIVGYPQHTRVDQLPLFDFDREITLPQVAPGTTLTVRLLATDRLGRSSLLELPLRIVAADPDTEPRTTTLEQTPLVSLTLPAEATPGQTIRVQGNAQPPDIKVRFPAPADLVGSEQLIVYEVVDFAGRQLLSLADTASLKTLEDGSRVIETNSPPYRGLRRDISKLVLAVYTNEIISFAQTMSKVAAFGSKGTLGAAVAMASSMFEQFQETLLGVDWIRRYSGARAADTAPYEFAVVPMVGGLPGTITLYDAETGEALLEADVEAVPPGKFSGVVILGEETMAPVVTATTSFKTDAVPLDASLSLAFSHFIDSETVNGDSLYLEDSLGNKVAGHIVFQDVSEEERYIVLFDPEAPLRAGEQYRLVATTGIERVNGEALAEEYRYTFTTAKPEGVIGIVPVPGADTFDMLGDKALVTARDEGAGINKWVIVDFSDPTNPAMLSEVPFDLNSRGEVRAVKGLAGADLTLHDGTQLSGDLAMLSAGSTDTFSSITFFDINDPAAPRFLAGTLVGTPVRSLLDTREVVIIPDYDKFENSDIYDPFGDELKNLPNIASIPWFIDSDGERTAYFINQPVGVMTVDLPRAIPPPPVEERGSQYGPSYAPVHKAAGVVVTPDPAFTADDGHLAITAPNVLSYVVSGDLTVSGTIADESIARVVVNGFRAEFLTDEEGAPIGFLADIEILEGPNLVTASAFDRYGDLVGEVQVQVLREYSVNPFAVSPEITTSLPPLSWGAGVAAVDVTVEDEVLFDSIFVSGELAGRKNCDYGVTQKGNACGWDGTETALVPLEPGTNRIVATTIDEDETAEDFVGFSFYDLAVQEGLVLAVNDDLTVFDSGGLVRIAEVPIPGGGFRVTIAQGVMTDLDGDGRTGFAENEDGDDVTVTDELRNLALVGTGSDGTLVLVDITEPHKAAVIGRIDLATPVYRARAVPTDGMAYVATGGGIVAVDLTRPNLDFVDDNGDGDDDRILGVTSLPGGGTRDLRLDLDRGIAFVLQKEQGIAVVKLDPCKRDVGIDVTRLPAESVVRDASLETERQAILDGLEAGMGSDVCASFTLLPDPPEGKASAGFLAQGSSACLWREDGKCSSAYQPGLSDHDFELIVPDASVEAARVCAGAIKNAIIAQDVMKNAEVTVFPVPRSAFTHAYRDVSPVSGPQGEALCGGEGDTYGDLCLGRNGLMLKWFLEGEWVGEGATWYDGGLDLQAALNRLKAPIIEDSQYFDPEVGAWAPVLKPDVTHTEPSHIPRLEGLEWACSQEFALDASGARIRIKGTGIGDVPIQSPVFRKKVQKAAKAGIRAVYGKLLSTTRGNRFVLDTSRPEYNAPDGCFTSIVDPDLADKTLDDFGFKRCESFEEFVASKALLAALRQIKDEDGDLVMPEDEGLLAYELFRRKADVGSQITDEEEANVFIARAMGFIHGLHADPQVKDTYDATLLAFGDEAERGENYARCRDDFIPRFKPGGEEFGLTVPVRVYNGGFQALLGTRFVVYQNDQPSVEMKDDGDEVPAQRDILDLAPGENRWFKLRVPAAAGSHRVQVIADPDDRLVELDKRNNHDGFHYYYLEDPPGTDLSVQPANGDPRPGPPPGLEPPAEGASKICLVDGKAPPSARVEVIALLDDQASRTVRAGEHVQQTWIVRNTGNVALESITLRDSHGNAVTLDLGGLEPGGSTTETATLTAGEGGKTALGLVTVSGVDGNGNTVGVASSYTRLTAVEPDAFQPEPVILIPGIAGSRINLNNNQQEFWPAIKDVSALLQGLLQPTDKRKLTLNPISPHYQGPDAFYASDIIRNIEVQLLPAVFQLEKPLYSPLIDAMTHADTGWGYTEYDYKKKPEYRTTAGCLTDQTAANLFVFPYDWRRSNRYNAERLADYVGCIRQIHPHPKRLNIVAHSMGGLVARRFVLDNPGEIDKLISIGSPWLGTPRAAQVLITGEFVDSWLEEQLVIQPAVMRELAPSLPGVHELLPSRALFDITEQDVRLQDDGGDVWPPFEERGQGITPPINAVDAYVRYLQFFDDNLFNVVEENAAFHGYTALSDGGAPAGEQDDWTEDGTGARFYHIVGLQESTTEKTVGQVYVEETLLPFATPESALELEADPVPGSPTWNLNTYGQFLFYQVPLDQVGIRYAQGDGTVMVTSLDRRTPGGTNFNSYNAWLKVYQADNEAGPSDEQVEHNGILANPAMHLYLRSILQPWAPEVQGVEGLLGEPARTD